MALIKCKECGKEVSDKAKSCPNCGAINIKPKTVSNNTTNSSNDSSVIAIIITIIVFGLLAWGFISLFSWITKPVEKEGEKLLNAFGVTHEGNDLIIKEKSSSQVKDDVMDWMGFEKIEN